MAGDLIPPNGGNGPYKETKGEGDQHQNDQLDKIYIFCRKHGKTIAMVAVVVVLVETISVFLWHFADVFHGIVAAFCHWVSLCGQLFVFTLPASKLVKWRKAAWSVFGIISASMGLFIFLDWHSKRPESVPHFVFSLRRIDPPGEFLKLTNSFLNFVISKDSVHVPGLLIVPIEAGQSNLDLRIGIDNESEENAEDGFVTILVHKDLGFDSTSNWSPVTFEHGDNVEESGGIFETNPDTVWGTQLPTLLPNTGINLPDIILTNIPILYNGEMPFKTLALESQCKGLNFEGIVFGIAGFQKQQGQTNNIPVMVNLSSGGRISPEILENLQR